MKQLKKYYLPVLFLLVIWLPLLNNEGVIWKFERTKENRVFHDSVNTSFNNINNVSADFELYYNDNMAFRSPLLKLFHKIKFKIFHVSSDDENLIIGKNGWYFLAGKEKAIFEGRENFSETEIGLFDALWKERLAYLNSKKIKAYWLICPIKQYIYEDQLPNTVQKAKGKSRTKLLKEKLDQHFPGFVLDPTEFLIAQKKKHRLYFQMDNHWNERAGNLVTEFVLTKLKKDFPLLSTDYLKSYVWRDTIKQDGMHYASLGIKELFENIEITNVKTPYTIDLKTHGFVPPENFAYAYAYEYHFSNATKGHYKILVIRDSFGDNVMPFMKEAFSESTFIFDAWKYGMDKEIIEKVKPDIILYLSLETHLENFIAN